MNKRKILALLLAVVMICSLFVSPALAADDEGIVAISDNTEAPKFTDLEEGHWAESAIIRWAEEGIIEGDGNGTINPARSLKRAELATVLTRLLGLKDKASADTFSDVAADAWYADAVLKCAKAGIMLGDGTGKANPEAPIDRQQTIVMVGRALGVKPATGHSLDRFDDGDTVADWAAPYMIALTDMNILNGLPTGEGDGAIVAPTVNIDRASTFTLLDKAIAQYITAPCTVTVDDANKFVVVNSAAEEKGVVTVTGKTAGVVVATGTTDDVVLDKATVGTLKVDAPVDVTVNRGSSVTDLDANAPADVTNNGTVTNLNTNADDVTFDGNKPSKVNTAEDVKPATDSRGNEVTEAPTTSGGGSSSSGGNTPSVVKKADVVAAPSVDQGKGDFKFESVTDSETKAEGTVKTAGNETTPAEYDVKITARGVKNHTNAAQADGHWVGFGMPAKEAKDNDEVKDYTYLVGDTAATAEEVPTIAERKYPANGKVYNTVYFSEDTEEAFNAAKRVIVVMDGETKVATYNVTFDVTFYKATNVTVKAELTDAEGNPVPEFYQKFAISKVGENMKADVKDTAVSITGTLDPAKLNKNTEDGPTEYTYYVMLISDANIAKVYNNGLGEQDAREPMLLAVRIWDNANKQLLKATHEFQMKDAAGRVQDTVTVTVDATACTVKGMNIVSFVDHDGTIVEKKFIEGEAEITTPAAPARDGHYFTGWGVEGPAGQMNLVAAGDSVTINNNTTFTAQYVEIKAQTAALRKNGPEGNNNPAVDPFPYATTYGKAGITFDATTNTITLDATELMKYKATENNQLNHLLGGNGKTLFVGLEYAAPQGATQYAWAATAEALRNETLTALSTDTQSTYGNALITYIAFAELENDEFNFLADVEDNANNALESTPYILWADASGNVVGVTKATLSRKTVNIPEPPAPTTYTVTFKNGDEVVKEENLEEGAAITPPADPTKEDAIFLGWVDAEDNLVNFTNLTATADVTYTAKYLEIGAQTIQTRPSGPANNGETNCDYGAVYTAAGVTLSAQAEDGSYTYTINADTFLTYAITPDNKLGVLAATVGEKTYYFYGAAIMAPEKAAKLILTNDNALASLDDAGKCTEFDLESSEHSFTIEGQKCILHYFGAVADKDGEGVYGFQPDGVFTRYAKWVDAQGNIVAVNKLVLKRVTNGPTTSDENA